MVNDDTQRNLKGTRYDAVTTKHGKSLSLPKKRPKPMPCQSFQNESFWMPRNVGCPKRPQQWVVDPSEQQLLSKKRSIPTAGMGNLNAELKGFDDQLGMCPLVSLPVSHAIQDPSFYYGGIRRVKVNQVGASDNGLPVSIGHLHSRGDNNLSIDAVYNMTDKNMSLSLIGDREEGTAISMGPTFTKPNDNYISMDHTFNKGDGSFMLMGHNLSKGYDNRLSISQPFDKGDGAFASVGHVYEKGNLGIIPASHDNKEHENFISMVSTYGKDNGNFISFCPFYSKGDGNSISRCPSSVAASTYVIPRATTDEKGNSGNILMEENCTKGKTGSNSVGDFHTNPSGGMTSGYDLMANQFPDQTSAPGLENAAVNKIVAQAATAKTNTTPKIKESKPCRKVEPDNSFPSNVKCLLSTGILNGVPVKYVSWEREHNLKGIVSGNGYLCGCKDCNFSKCLTAYELERHAGCKTKHPNNHIYFQNGKTIYAVVQELKNTPQDMLFEAIEKATGSPINQKNFCTWKASYQAATRELQRIYGKDKETIAS